MMEQEEKNLLREETNDEIFAAAKECGLTTRICITIFRNI